MVNITEPKMSAYLHSRARQNGTPLAGNFELTCRCNFNCPMCYVHNEKKTDLLKTEDWLYLTDEACENGMLFLLLTGGEPLLRNDFKKIYTHAHEKGLIISINSNGSLINNYLDLFKKYPPVRINISLYASNSDGYKNRCSADYFDSVVNNINALREIDIPVKLNAVITKSNCDDMDNIIALSKSLGIPVQISPYCYPQVRLGSAFADNNARLSAEDAGKYSVKSDITLYGEDEFIRKAKLSNKSRIITDDDCSISCRAGVSSFWITHDGKMRACAMMDSPYVDINNKSFIECWTYIREQTSLLRMPAECAGCPDARFCRACAAMCYCETGSTDKKPEYVCGMIRSIRENTDLFLKKRGNVSED